MTRTRKVLLVALIVVVVLGALAAVAYVLYVVVILAMLHAAFHPACPPSYEKLTNACTALAKKDSAVHCKSSRVGPMPSGPQGICEAFNLVDLDWVPDPDAGWHVQPSEYGSIEESTDASYPDTWACESDGLTLWVKPGAERSPEEITRIRAAFDTACTAFRSR